VVFAASSFLRCRVLPQFFCIILITSGCLSSGRIDWITSIWGEHVVRQQQVLLLAAAPAAAVGSWWNLFSQPKK